MSFGTELEPERSRKILDSYETPQPGLYLIGTYDVGVTVYSQQVRALNLAWAMVECEVVQASTPGGKGDDTQPKRIAVVGGGFAGLTLAAALIKKGVKADITLFERRDTLLPLQQGSDSRWVHPRIYDWPAIGSEMVSAALPVLNWTAGRASDVAVQILRAWKKIVRTLPPSLNGAAEAREQSPTTLSVYCNTHHLQVHGADRPRDRLRVEWVGDLRPLDVDSATHVPAVESRGTSEEFDIVVLAVGFGLERDQALSYWRNETLSQAYLGQGRATYIVSGQGDGAMIDLLRIRVTEFRQDRILADLFEDSRSLIAQLRRIQDELASSDNSNFLFEAFEGLYEKELESIAKKLAQRLRRDTQVVLHTKVKRISDLFNGKNAKISFQNKLLVYLLYKCGGFIPSSMELDSLQKEYAVSYDRVIRRHGTLRDELLKDLLDESFFKKLKERQEEKPSELMQFAQPKWTSGFFYYPGLASTASSAPDEFKKSWRKEYLPAATELIASAFCSAVAGYLGAGPDPVRHLRVTLHRVVTVGDEEVMQQACQYSGNSTDERMRNTAGRTFPPTHATIGLAYATKKIVASEITADVQELQESMGRLHLQEASRNMSEEVQSLIAIPLVCPFEKRSGGPGERVFAMLYADAFSNGWFSSEVIEVLVKMCQNFVNEIEQVSSKKVDRLSNYTYQPALSRGIGAGLDKLPGMDVLENYPPPRATIPLALNFDHADFVII